jgi:hypothetical protein
LRDKWTSSITAVMKRSLRAESLALKLKDILRKLNQGQGFQMTRGGHLTVEKQMMDKPLK